MNWDMLGHEWAVQMLEAGHETPALVELASHYAAERPVAVNMTAVAKQYGAAHRAFIIVPLVCGFFIDLVNALVKKG